MTADPNFLEFPKQFGFFELLRLAVGGMGIVKQKTMCAVLTLHAGALQQRAEHKRRKKPKKSTVSVFHARQITSIHAPNPEMEI